jgi:cyclopropane-fatty-acyl-phospholipid synthase
MMDIFEPWHFSVLDVENLRPHYALTIEHWLKRFEDSREQVREMYGESFVRAWRFYLCGSMAAFRTGALQLFQVLFDRSGNQDEARTRDYLNKAVQ